MIMKSELETRMLEKAKAAGLPADAATMATCKKMLGIALESIQEAVVNDGGVRITGFGTFGVSRHQERTGRNMQTGEPVTIPAHSTVSFKPGMTFKRAVRDA